MTNTGEQVKDMKDRRSLGLRAGLAAAGATALLLGGVGAFSLWSDSESAKSGGNISSGTLDITGVTGEKWYYAGETTGGGTEKEISDITTYKASPGDILEFRATVAISVVGSDMKAELIVDDATYKIAPELASYVTVEMNTVTNAATGSYPVVVTVTFSDTIPDRIGQNIANAVSLQDMSFRLNQVVA